VTNKRKKQQGTILPFFFLLLSFFICLCSCNMNGSEASASKSFDSKLRGKWVSNDPTGSYNGSLVIDSGTITIDGYEKGQTPYKGDDNKRPFRDFPRGEPLKGYSEEGKIFIEYGSGSTRDGIPYTYTPEEYPNKVKFLEFVFGGEKEILQSK